MRTLVIVNPRSRSGATGRRWRRVEPRVRAALGPLEVEFTRARRDAERIAREGVRAGIERLVIAGGDGTLNEVATGLLAAELGRYVQLGLLPLGTGGDFVRTLGVPHELDGALACIAGGKLERLDAGRITYRDDEGREAVAWFCNVASVGISALVEDIVSRTTFALGGRVAFAIGTLKGVFGYASRPVAIRVDGDAFFDGPLVLAAAANGRYFGGGMAIGPEARPDDGLLDVVAVPAMSRLELIAKFPRIYRGMHLSDPAVRSRRGRRVELEAEPGAVRIEADGDPLGALPARIELIPDALSFLGPAT